MKLDRSEDILNPTERTLKETFGSMSELVKQAFQGRRNGSEPAPGMPDSLSAPPSWGEPEPHGSHAESWRMAPFVDIFRKNFFVKTLRPPRLKNYPYTTSRPGRPSTTTYA